MSQISVARIVAEARSWCGTPYAHQASLKHIGADCLGLVRGVYAALYRQSPQPPAYAPFAVRGEPELLLDAAQHYLIATEKPIAAGQVLLFRMRRNLPIRHAAISTSPQKMVHAMSGGTICEVDMNGWWCRHCVARFVFPDPDGCDE